MVDKKKRKMSKIDTNSKRFRSCVDCDLVALCKYKYKYVKGVWVIKGCWTCITEDLK